MNVITIPSPGLGRLRVGSWASHCASFSFLEFFYYSSLPLSMASSSTMLCVSKVVELRANGVRIPLLFPIYANGFALPFTLVLGSRCKIVPYGSNARFMIMLVLNCHWPCVSILGLLTTDLPCGNFALVNTECTDSQILAHMYPWKSVPLPVTPLPL